MTDIGVTGGGSGRHMVYAAGRQDHTMPADTMVEHIVELVTAKAEVIQAELDATKAQEAADASRLPAFQAAE